MAKNRRLTREEQQTITDLADRFGERKFRTLFRQEGEQGFRTGPLKRERLANLSAGRGRITEQESAQLKLLRRNSRAIEALAKRGEKLGRKPYEINRAIRQWIGTGKVKDAPNSDDSLRAIRALRFLGVDVDAGIFYLSKGE